MTVVPFICRVLVIVSRSRIVGILNVSAKTQAVCRSIPTVQTAKGVFRRRLLPIRGESDSEVLPPVSLT